MGFVEFICDAVTDKKQVQLLLFGDDCERNALVRHMKICSESGYSEQERIQ